MAKPHARPNPQGGRAVQVSTAICECGHELRDHHNGDCIAIIYPKKGTYCRCRQFRPVDRVEK
jgi:hypothetical protein